MVINIKKNIRSIRVIRGQIKKKRIMSHFANNGELKLLIIVGTRPEMVLGRAKRPEVERDLR